MTEKQLKFQIKLKWWVWPFVYLVAYPLENLIDGFDDYAINFIAEKGLKVKVIG